MHRHASTHAAGVVIGPKPLVEILPLYTDHRSNMPITQYSMKYSETAGLVKFDFLGLKTLTLIAKTIEMIKQNEGVEIDIDTIPLDDKKTFAMLAEGKGVGVFQMESAGMRDSMRKMKVDSIEDIIALISLYRPGPMENIPRYIACKHGKEKPDYLHPLLEDCLKETYGVIIYQEQVMQIAQILGGYTLGAADLLRRAMGKKIKAEMDAQREIFVKGAVENKVKKEKAEEIFDLVAKFAGYGFNKSHAAAYAAIGYQTAYLKAHYPAEFLCACMNQVIGDTDKVLVFREEARRMGIDVLEPDINNSYAYFTVEELGEGKKGIRYALGALKNVSIEAVKQIAKERDKNGKFESMVDFLSRVEAGNMNKRQMESFAMCGAFDGLHENRRQLFEEASIIIKHNQLISEEKNANQESLFGGEEFEIKDIKLQPHNDWNDHDRVVNEAGAIGFFLKNHPVSEFLDILPKDRLTFVEGIQDRVTNLRSSESMFTTTLIGVPNKVVHRTSNGRRFSYFSLSDQTGMIEINIFNDDLINASRDMLETMEPIVCSCEARVDEGGVRIIAQEIIAAKDYLKTIRARTEININEADFSAELLEEIRLLADNDNSASIEEDDSSAEGSLPIKLNFQTRNGFLLKMKIPEAYNIRRDKVKKLNNINGLKYEIKFD
jgi:DNA polymerase-3 subunit alpha